MRDVRRVQLADMKQKNLTLKCEVVIANPNAYAIHVKSVEGLLYLDGTLAGASDLKSGFSLKADTTLAYPVEIVTDLSKGEASLLQLGMIGLLKKKLDIRLTGTVSARAGLISKKVPFDERHLIELGK